MSRDDNKTDYLGFSSHLIFKWDEFDLTVIEFLAGFSLFSQIQYKFGMDSGIVTLVLPRLYFKNILLLFYFIL